MNEPTVEEASSLLSHCVGVSFETVLGRAEELKGVGFCEAPDEIISPVGAACLSLSMLAQSVGDLSGFIDAMNLRRREVDFYPAEPDCIDLPKEMLSANGPVMTLAAYVECRRREDASLYPRLVTVAYGRSQEGLNVVQTYQTDLMGTLLSLTWTEPWVDRDALSMGVTAWLRGAVLDVLAISRVPLITDPGVEISNSKFKCDDEASSQTLH